MPGKMITLLSPLGRQIPLQTTPAPVRIRRKVLGLFSNHKMHATRLLTDISRSIGAQFPDLELRFYEKPGAALVSPVELLARIKAECGLVLSGQGD